MTLLDRPERLRWTGSMGLGLGVVCVLLLGACSSNAPAQAPSVDGPAPGGGTASGNPAVTPALAAPGSQAGVDQCSFLTAAEIETATGLEVVGSGPDPSGISGCVWTLSGEGLNQIGLSVEVDNPRATQDQGFDCTEGFGLEQLEAVGDSACGDTVTGGEYLLSALRGDDRVRLRISSDTNYNDSVDKSAWATLARAVLAKLE
jgi:hypothetical protein